MEPNLKKHNLKEAIEILDTEPAFLPLYLHEWKEELQQLNFSEWFEEHKIKIVEMFKLHSPSRITPFEVLRFFVRHEILGETT